MSVEQNKQKVLRIFEEAFNRGDLHVIDEVIAPAGIDHQHPNEPSFAQHLKETVVAMRTAFPDLRFEVIQMLGEGEWVACYSIMTGTNTGELGRQLILSPQAPLPMPPTGKTIRVPHLHMIRFQDSRSSELFHLMDVMAMVAQLGLSPARDGQPIRA